MMMMGQLSVWRRSGPPLFYGLGITFLSVLFIGDPAQAEDFINEPVETLETIEVPATAVIQEERQIAIPTPDMNNLTPFPTDYVIQPYETPGLSHQATSRKIVRDSIADRKGKRKPVRPAKAERPPYPQFAREQGWEGTVVLRIQVNQTGTVDSVETRKSSGFSILDESALQSVKTWTFEPAKDGEIPIPVTVDLPIRFDLDEP